MEDNDGAEIDALDTTRSDYSSSDSEYHDVEEYLQQESNDEELVDERHSSRMDLNESNRENAHSSDTEQPATHSYLGRELEVVRGRTVLDDNAIVMMELLHPADLVLMPGQTLPLTVFDIPTINMLRSCLSEDRTFGVLASWTDGGNTTINTIGTTAEIYEYLPGSDESSSFKVKAMARQRFRLLDAENSSDSRWKAKVKILPEVRLPDPLDGIKLQSLNRFRSSPTNRQRCRRADAAVTRWPLFVFEQYNADRLIRCVKEELNNFLQQETKCQDKDRAQVKVAFSDDPTELSFWVAQNLPLKEKHRLILLNLNSPIQRLRLELRALQQCHNMLCCRYCFHPIGDSSDLFSMSSEGPQGTYVNPGGYLHETLTLYKVLNLYSVGPPSKEFSWFPGYAWSISKCKICNQHLGWKFTSLKKEQKPPKFWGICRRSITIRGADPENDQDFMVVF